MTLTPTAGQSLSGTYNLTIAGNTTAPLAFSASAATVQTALQATLGAGSDVTVSVTGTAAAGYALVVSVNVPSGANLAPIVVGSGSLGGSPTVVVTVLEDGSSDLFQDPVPSDYLRVSGCVWVCVEGGEGGGGGEVGAAVRHARAPIGRVVCRQWLRVSLVAWFCVV